MKRFLRLLIPAVAVFCLCSCASFKDIKVHSGTLESLTPHGLSSMDAVLSLDIENPAQQVTLSHFYILAKMDGRPCLHLMADDIVLESRCRQPYQVGMHGHLDEDFNPLNLMVLVKKENLDRVTLDVSFRGTLKSGLWKDFSYIDLPLTDIMGKL